MNESQATTSQISTLVLKDMAVGHIYTRGQWVTVGPTWAIGPMQSEESGKWPHHRLGIWSQEEAPSKSPATTYSSIRIYPWRKASMKMRKLPVLHECLLSLWDPDNPANCISKLEVDLTEMIRPALLPPQMGSWEQDSFAKCSYKAEVTREMKKNPRSSSAAGNTTPWRNVQYQLAC